MQRTGQDIDTDAVVRLVLGIARLGEADLAGWWSTHGLDRAGRYVLSRSFRRTWRSAALELDVLSATRRHDDALRGRRTALHLFSDELPFRRWALAWLAEQKTATEPSVLFDDLASWTLDESRRILADWAGPITSGEAIADGLRLGELSADELNQPNVLLSTARILTAAYAGLREQFLAPYFDLRR
jgi:hypothetical protein